MVTTTSALSNHHPNQSAAINRGKTFHQAISRVIGPLLASALAWRCPLTCFTIPPQSRSRRGPIGASSTSTAACCQGCIADARHVLHRPLVVSTHHIREPSGLGGDLVIRGRQRPIIPLLLPLLVVQALASPGYLHLRRP
ncbi:hypothetical protein QTO34_005499 [Cnephaeus nilssonii]|uniref:Uncharacterized protein n=1 Tax=Cnephaeus nilssonii TaxID=3371016 RepID=A0AA40HNN8_CNENI|nr:hypothetical protein QTO34_005499 [Eptesicus nilssonii]